LSSPSKQAAVPASRGHLLQILGVAFGLAVIVGNTIGVGILRTPGDIAKQLPSPPWFLGVWVVGGIYALLGALTLAELGAMLPVSGGQYVFARRAFGDYAGFAIGWSDWLSSCAAGALVTVTIGDYSDVLLPALHGHSAAIAVLMMLLLTAINARGIRAGDLTQEVTSLLKMLVLVGLAGVCLVFVPENPVTSTATGPGASWIPTLTALVLAFQGVIYTYDGWNGLLYFSGEVKNPGRDIPRSMAGGVLAVIAIYLLLNIAFMRVLPLSSMAGETLVAAAAAEAIFGSKGDTVVRVVILLSLFSAANAILLIGSRLPYGLSRDGLVTRGMSSVNPGGTPLPALLITALATIALIVSGTFNQILALAAFFYVVNYTASFLSVLVLRKREPALPRPYHAIGYPWVTWFLVLGSLGFLVGTILTDRRNSLVSLGLLVASYPVYRILRARREEEGGT
jgi:APA family basic amino acid/polyamine antiporter